MAAFRINRQHSHGISSKFLYIPAVILILIVLIGGYMFFWYQSNIKAFSVSQEDVVITVPIGMTSTQISVLLEQKSVIKSSRAFDWYTKLNNNRILLQAGGYKFKPSFSVEKIVDMLVNGEVSTELVTIFPERRIDQIRADFKEFGYSDEEIKSAFNPVLYKDHPVLVDKPPSSSLEGYLYPETFQKTSQTTLEQIIRGSLNEMYKAIEPNIDNYKREGLNIHQAVTLASIIEREVSNTQDRKQVAQVFLKRLNDGIMLGSDITAFYGANIAGLDRSVFTDTPYNTRLHGGLPPGPVSNVGTSSLNALASPASGNFLYFVAGDDGNTYFSYTLEEHNQNASKYCVKLCQ